MSDAAARSDLRLARIQAISGLALAVFVTIHLVNTALAAWGPEAYDGFQRALRPLYQFPLFEIVAIVGAGLVHLGVGVMRWRRRSGAGRPKPGLRTRLHRWSALYLAVVIGGHFLAVRGSSLFCDVYPEFGGVSLTLWWLPWLFYPYYVGFTAAALYHGWNGVQIALARFGVGFPKGLRSGPGFWVPLATATLLVWLGLLGFGGWLGPIPDPTDNDAARLVNREFAIPLDD